MFGSCDFGDGSAQCVQPLPRARAQKDARNITILVPLDRVAPGVKTQDINNLFGALDSAIPGLGKVVKENANVGVAVGINALGTEAVLEGKKARTFPLRFANGTVFLGPLKVADVPPLF